MGLLDHTDNFESPSDAARDNERYSAGVKYLKLKKRYVELWLTKKDAQYLRLMLTLPTVINEFTIPSSQPARKRILSKLKREGVK